MEEKEKILALQIPSQLYMDSSAARAGEIKQD